MSESVITRIAITETEWADLRKLAIDRNLRPSQLLASLVRAALAPTVKGEGK